MITEIDSHADNIRDEKNILFKPKQMVSDDGEEFINTNMQLKPQYDLLNSKSILNKSSMMTFGKM